MDEWERIGKGNLKCCEHKMKVWDKIERAEPSMRNPGEVAAKIQLMHIDFSLDNKADILW